jgi:hypothetical protein|tara:strand:+ start:917 stop:1360 length:444 start_codon:yes stop_codon:yes gene_type:complete
MDEGEPEIPSDDAFEDVSRQELIEFLGDFMSGNMRIESVYRSHLCSTLVARVHAEFGPEGLAEMMLKIDETGGWISDILLEAPDLENAMFEKFGVYDPELTKKARDTRAMYEMNKKIWRLRKRYAKLITDEIYESGSEPESVEAPEA